MKLSVQRISWRLAGLLACSFTSVFAQSYRVDIGANNLFPVPSPAYDFGCPFCPHGFWNAVDASVPGSVGLFDINSVSAGVTLSHIGGLGNFQFDNPLTLAGSDHERLFDDLQNVGPLGSTATWTLHGLPNGSYKIQICGWAPDDQTQLTAITVQGGAHGAQICGGTMASPFTLSDAAFRSDTVNVSNGELSFTAQAVQGFGSLNGFLIDPLPCGGLFPFCTAKLNSLGCTPQWSNFGTSSASATSGFSLRAVNVLNQKPGLLMYGFDGRAAIPFQGGTLCVNGPIHRGPAVTSHGSPSNFNDCTGMFALDMNAFAAGLAGGNPHPSLRIPGTLVTCQWWGRDPGFPPPDATTLSMGVQYFVCP
jgi:hypothetical protein